MKEVNMEKSRIICPFYQEASTHGMCNAFPWGLMNPSIKEMKLYCLTNQHRGCSYYQYQQTDKEQTRNRVVTLVNTALAWEV
jgi:hypothetical protein